MKEDRKSSQPDRLVRKQSDAAIVVVSLAVLFAGPMFGIALARTFAPTSGIALFIGFFLFPCAHFAGRLAWAAMGFVVDPNSEGRRTIRALANLVRLMDEQRAPREASNDNAHQGRFPRGGLVFILVHVLVSLVAGLIVGLFLSDMALTTVAGAYSLTGTLYGVVVYWLAEKGYLLMRTERAT
jgi:hypothetical protein